MTSKHRSHPARPAVAPRRPGLPLFLAALPLALPTARRKWTGNGHTAGQGRWPLGLATMLFAAGLTAPADAAVPGANGKIAFKTTRITQGVLQQGLWAMDPDGSGPASIFGAPGHNFNDPAWSPDGTRIAFQSDLDDGNGEIYEMNADGTGVTRLTNDAFIDLEPAWSPDDARIAFASNRDGITSIYAMNSDGSWEDE